MNDSEAILASSLLYGGVDILSVRFDTGVFFDDWADEPEEPTRPHLEGFQSPIQELLLRAVRINPDEDQPYMPMRCTTREEALAHLQQTGRVGVEGGHLLWQKDSDSFFAAFVGGNPFMISRAEAVSLLKGNYTSESKRA